MISKKSSHGFSEQHALHQLKHFLPTQGPLKDFVHHNTLHAFQDMKFYDAIYKASAIFGYQTTFSLQEYRDLYAIQRITPEMLQHVIRDQKGDAGFEEWYTKCLYKDYDTTSESHIGTLRDGWRRHYPINLDNEVHPLLFRIVCSYIDQGIAITPFPYEDQGLLNAVRLLEQNSLVSFFKTKQARKLLRETDLSISKLLNMIVGKGKDEYFEEYLYDQQFAHRGWSGMVSTLEDRPESLLYPKKIALEDLVILELLLEFDALTYVLGDHWKPLGSSLTQPPRDVFDVQPATELQAVIRLWHDAFEWSYYDTVLSGIGMPDTKSTKQKSKKIEKSMQAVFCIDEREYSLRTYVESLDDRAETFGAPGFFGVEFYFHPAGAKFYDKLCPAPVTPQYLIKEIAAHEPHTPGKDIMYAKHSHRLLGGFFLSYFLGLTAIGRLIANLVYPRMSPAIADAFAHMDPSASLTIEHTDQAKEEGLQVGFTVSEMTDRVEKLLRNIGLTHDFASLVYILGHGSSSANNPHHGAHDCGACSGRPGLVNARVFAYMANYQPVRDMLAERGLTIPDNTQFLGGLHDTASDEIRFYDESILSKTNRVQHRRNQRLFEDALDLNAKERSRRFVSISTKNDIKRIRSDIKKRSVSYFEPRPELGHGTNALCVVGRREMTKHLFLDRRAFLNSYDYTSDPDGTLLQNVLAPLGIVCGGINLEYYFSRMDNYKLGAGTKLPHNVMGLVGVANSSDGDLRSGLPLQMIEVHDPVRLLMIVEHFPDVVKKVIESNPALHEWFANEWIHLVAVNPKDKSLSVYRDQKFVPYTPLTQGLPEVRDISKMFESTTKMPTNHILDATKENLPVHILK